MEWWWSMRSVCVALGLEPTLGQDKPHPVQSTRGARPVTAVDPGGRAGRDRQVAANSPGDRK